ncbi:hypothetical protein [uncultured Corynebacterium sp.]|uniref:hypothetical protein n=1 Tax=uncultured Corynebacterium sp. TaxID=159447 RepID=UPI0025DD5D97|nr:hypothetical protein [uncultured Corynebacterium sp.]
MIFCGIDLLDTDLLAGEMGRQIRARTKVYDIRTYSYGSAAARESWVELVAGMEALLPLAAHPVGSLTTPELAGYLWNRTSGSIGSLRNLLGDAAIDAIFSGKELVDRAGLDDVILDQEAVRGQKPQAAVPKKATRQGKPDEHRYPTIEAATGGGAEVPWRGRDVVLSPSGGVQWDNPVCDRTHYPQ